MEEEERLAGEIEAKAQSFARDPSLTTLSVAQVARIAYMKGASAAMEMVRKMLKEAT